MNRPTKPNLPAPAHSSVVGGSSASRVLHCPGSIPLVQSVPEGPSSEYAAEGTALHAAIAYLLEHDLPVDKVRGMVFDGYEMTDELVGECLEPCIQAFDDIVGDNEFELEVRLPFPDIEGAFGTMDVLYYSKRGYVAGGIDWKFGGGVAVEADDNSQLKFYLRGAIEGAKHEKTIVGTIVQPRHQYVGTDSFTARDLHAFGADLKHAVKLQSGLTEGPWCRFCPALAICPEKHKRLDALGQLHELAKTDLPRLLVLADTVEPIITEIRRLALEALEHGQTVEGWKLVAKRATRSWTHDDDATAAALEIYAARGLPTIWTEPALKSPAQVEKILGKALPLPDDLVTKASSGNTIAPADDPRPSINAVGQLKRLASLAAKGRME